MYTVVCDMTHSLICNVTQSHVTWLVIPRLRWLTLWCATSHTQHATWHTQHAKSHTQHATWHTQHVSNGSCRWIRRNLTHSFICDVTAIPSHVISHSIMGTVSITHSIIRNWHSVNHILSNWHCGALCQSPIPSHPLDQTYCVNHPWSNEINYVFDHTKLTLWSTVSAKEPYN